MRKWPYINVSGDALNTNKTARFFSINAAQYTSHYKNNRSQSILPVQAHFNLTKYRTKKPIPSNNTYVSIEGFLEDVNTDSSGQATSFHISVNNINFLGRASLSPSTTGNTGNSFLSQSQSQLKPFLQLPPPLPALPVSSSTLTQWRQAHPMSHRWWILLLPQPSQKLVYWLVVGSEKNKILYCKLHLM